MNKYLHIYVYLKITWIRVRITWILTFTFSTVVGFSTTTISTIIIAVLIVIVIITEGISNKFRPGNLFLEFQIHKLYKQLPNTYLAHVLGQFSPQFPHFLKYPLDFSSVAHQNLVPEFMQEFCSSPWYLNGKMHGLFLLGPLIVRQSLSPEASKIYKTLDMLSKLNK